MASSTQEPASASRDTRTHYASMRTQPRKRSRRISAHHSTWNTCASVLALARTAHAEARRAVPRSCRAHRSSLPEALHPPPPVRVHPSLRMLLRIPDPRSTPRAPPPPTAAPAASSCPWPSPYPHRSAGAPSVHAAQKTLNFCKKRQQIQGGSSKQQTVNPCVTRRGPAGRGEAG